MRETRNFILILLTLILCLSGCDGFHRHKFLVNFDNNTSTKISAIRTNDHQGLFDSIENIAVKNRLKCNPYREDEKYFGCGDGGLNIICNVSAEDNSVSIELREFGHWWETKRYKSLLSDLSKLVKDKYSGEEISGY